MESLDVLEKSLDNLEEVLASLLDRPFLETLDQLELIQKAKFQVLLPYVVNDLVFIYLRTRGINPKTHPVVGELDRIKQYFDKIKKAEDPEKRRFAVDQDAATRFIKHAIKESQALQEQTQLVPNQGTHTRFDETDGPRSCLDITGAVAGSAGSEAALAKIVARETALRQEDSLDESELEVFAEPAPQTVEKESSNSGKEEHKGAESLQAIGKKRRRGMDPWAGYGETSGASTSKQRHKRTKKADRSRNKGPSVEIDISGGMEGGERSITQCMVQTTAVNTSQENTNTSPEMIDADVLPPELSDNQGQAIDIGAETMSGTPIQDKTRGKKKKKKKPSNI